MGDGAKRLERKGRGECEKGRQTDKESDGHRQTEGETDQ